MTTEEAQLNINMPVVYQPEDEGPEKSRGGVITAVVPYWREGYPPEHQSAVYVRFYQERVALPCAPELLTLAEQVPL